MSTTTRKEDADKIIATYTLVFWLGVKRGMDRYILDEHDRALECSQIAFIEGGERVATVY